MSAVPAHDCRRTTGSFPVLRAANLGVGGGRVAAIVDAGFGGVLKRDNESLLRNRMAHWLEWGGGANVLVIQMAGGFISCVIGMTPVIPL